MSIYIWLILMIGFIIAEAACPFHLVSIWFAAGALVAAIAAALHAPLWLQITLFIVISGALLVALWPFVRKVLNPSHAATNIDSVIGSQGYVTEDIDNMDAVGQVKLGGMYWSARSTSGDPIAKGTLIRVDKIEGVKVFVTPVKAAEPVG